jgi:hypothetical protein
MKDVKLAELLMVGLLSATIASAEPTTSGLAKPIPTPAWAKDLVIYEIATKSFTSPAGPESGTFNSLRAKLPYLHQLGITGIWLAGHSTADPRHFFNIWSQYAVIEPDRIDPSLGTEADFRVLVDEAHKRGIRIFLDVITHGVMKQSSLVTLHPNWFLGAGWGGMVEYDWFGGHTDLDDWWVKTWTEAVARYGVDGFRLDLGTTRPDLWARIRQRAAAEGHPIVVFEESATTIPGVTDFGQVNNFVFSRNGSMIDNDLILDDLPRFYATKFGSAGDYRVRLTFEGGKQVEVSTNTGGVKVEGLGPDKTSKRRTYYAFLPDGLPDVELRLGLINIRQLSKVEVAPAGLTENRGNFQVSPYTWSGNVIINPVDGSPWSDGNLALTNSDKGLLIHLPTLDYGNVLMLSCHDNGQVGFPAGKNPYSAQGSRAIFGYAFLFTPMIPLFMSGEEFNADFHPLPSMSPDFFGGRDPGKGTWLYGAQLNWKELSEPRHREMLEDVKRMIALRNLEPSLLKPSLAGDKEPQLVGVPFQASISVPTPYMRWNGDSAIVVLANRNTTTDARINLRIPVDKLGPVVGSKYRITDLWNGGPSRIFTAKALSSFAITVKRDEVAGGGIGLLKLERLSGQ